VDEDMLLNQAGSSEWKKEHMFCFTASSFQLTAKRQKNLSNLAQLLMHITIYGT